MEYLVTMTTRVPAGTSQAGADIVDRLPLRAWMTVETVPLTPHPNDPIDHPDGR